MENYVMSPHFPLFEKLGLRLEHLQQLAKKKISKAIFFVPKSYFLRFS